MELEVKFKCTNTKKVIDKAIAKGFILKKEIESFKKLEADIHFVEIKDKKLVKRVMKNLGLLEATIIKKK